MKQWVGLNVVTLAQLHQRWLHKPGDRTDALMTNARWNDTCWKVKSELELVRLIGALHVQNPNLQLWLRGEQHYWPTALPSRARQPSGLDPTPSAVAWLNACAPLQRVIRDRGTLARVAILQHYRCPTSFIDVTTSYEVAAAFAFEPSKLKAPAPHIRVYALPRHTSAVNEFLGADVVLVDLRAELPSYCARPHVQQSGFIARRSAAYRDIAGQPLSGGEAGLDELCIGHIHLDFDGRKRFYKSRIGGQVLYPQQSTSCPLCPRRGNKRKNMKSDMNGDFMLHFLRCLCNKVPGAPKGFPDAGT